MNTYIAIDQTDEVIVSHPSVEKETTSTDESQISGYLTQISAHLSQISGRGRYRRSQWKMLLSATLSHLTLSLANHGIN